MKLIKQIFLFFLFIGSITELSAQQESHYSQYMFNGFILNPAYAGSANGMMITLVAREQWLGVPGRPSTQTLGFHDKSKSGIHGYGGNVIVDRLGITAQIIMEGAYSYRIPFGSSTLALGLSGGVVNFRNNWSKAQSNDIDPNIPAMTQNQFLPKIGTGVYFYNKFMYMGLSTPNFMPSNYMADNPDPTVVGKTEAHIYTTAGFAIPVSSTFTLKPSFLMKYVRNAPVVFDLNTNIYYKDIGGLGVSYRTGDGLVFMLEYFPGKNLRFGYSYDFPLTQIRQVSSGSHELMVGIEIGKKDLRIVTPRYF